MSKLNREVIEKNKSSIRRGVYYFGIIGRISVFMGVIGFIFSIVPIFISLFDTSVTNKLAGSAIQSASYLIYGFLFLIARDAFQAVDALTNEIEEIV